MIESIVYINITPWKFKIAPENAPKGKDRLPTIIFHGRTVELRGCNGLIAINWKLLICSLFSRENGQLFLICSSHHAPTS